MTLLQKRRVWRVYPYRWRWWQFLQRWRYGRFRVTYTITRGKRGNRNPRVPS